MDRLTSPDNPQKDMMTIPFIAYEAALDREERQTKRLYYKNIHSITKHLI